MRDDVRIIRQRQCAIRREIDRRGIPLKQIEFDSGIPYETLLSYFPKEGGRDPAVMPVSALFALVGALPTDILSLLMPEGNIIVQVPVEFDPNRAGILCQDFLVEKLKAHDPESECGPAIGPNEAKVLQVKFGEVKAAA